MENLVNLSDALRIVSGSKCFSFVGINHTVLWISGYRTDSDLYLDLGAMDEDTLDLLQVTDPDGETTQLIPADVAMGVIRGSKYFYFSGSVLCLTGYHSGIDLYLDLSLMDEETLDLLQVDAEEY